MQVQYQMLLIAMSAVQGRIMRHPVIKLRHANVICGQTMHT